MIELLEHFSLEQIIIFVVLFSVLVKGVISYIDWLQVHIFKSVDKAKEPERIRESLQAHEEELQKINTTIDKIANRIDLLIQSDKDAIKAFITQQHHYFCYEKHWIDDFSLDCIQKRYAHYKEQGGNTFIGGMMEDLRELPQSSLQNEIKGGDD